MSKTVKNTENISAMQGGYSLCYNEWALDDRIRTELGLLMILSSLSAKKGYCFASNGYLAGLFGQDTTVISRKIKKLINCGYVIATYRRDGKSIAERKIILARATKLTKKSRGLDEKRNLGVDEKAKDNITSINNTILIEGVDKVIEDE